MSKGNLYLKQALGIVANSLCKTYSDQIKDLRSHCVARQYPMALLNTLTILELIVDAGHLPSLVKALGALERLNKHLDKHKNPKMAILQEIATAAQEAREARPKK